MKKRIIKFLIDKAKRSKLIQSVFEQPIDLRKLPVKGAFIDSNGDSYDLYEGLRTQLKPGWERIFNQDGKSFDKSPQRIENITQNGRLAVERIEPVINLFSSGIKDKKVLEIGCNSGGTTFAFADKGADEVVGSEFSGYKLESISSKATKNSDLKEVNENLKELRGLVKAKFTNPFGVSFVDDDICNSKIEPNYFDLIFSWDVLEHLHDPKEALKNMHNLLNDDGIAIHEYNPFFSLIGGHSACTIDFPWGHVLLNEHDFDKYNDDYQPERKNTAMSFYLNGLNRMTINDLKKYAKESNLEILSIIEFPKEQHLRMLNRETIDKATANYPTLEVNDLISYKIIVVFRKGSKTKK
jgi:SAM-dependent methyltransferase